MKVWGFYRLDFFTNQCCFIPRCAFSPPATATVLVSRCFHCTPLYPHSFFTTMYIGEDLW